MSGDDLMRSLIAHEWAKEPFISSASFGEVSATWMPLHFWIVGFFLKIYSDVWLIPALVSLLFSLLTLGMLYLTAQCLFNSSKTGLITVVLAGFLPWEVWLSVSGTAATIYQFTIISGIYCVLKWEESGRLDNKKLLLSSFAFLASTMLRPEGWFFAVVFSSYLLWFLFTPFLKGFTHWKHIENKWFIIFAASIPWLFIGYWLYFNFTAYGDPLYFVNRSKLSYQQEATSLDSFFIRALKFPLIMFVVSPMIFILTVISSARFFRSWARIRVMKTYLFFILAGLMLLITGSILGSGTRSTPQRYVILNIILFIPLVSSLLNHCMQTKKWRKTVWVSIIIFIGFNLATGYKYSKEYSDQAQVGRFLKKQWREKRLGVDDVICSERTFHAYRSIPLTGYIEKMYSLSNRWAMQVLSNHPDNFVFNVKEDIDLDLTMNREKIKKYFQDRKIRLIIVRSEETVKKIPLTFNLVGSIGGYMFFSDKPEIFKGTFPPPTDKIDNITRKNFGNALMLLGYNLDKNTFPRYITLYWKLKKQTNTDYRISLNYVDSKEKIIKHAKIINPHYGAYNTSQWRFDEIIEERIYFPFSEGLDAGNYFLRISMIDSSLRRLPIINGKADETELDIGPFTIISSKRVVIKKFLQGKLKDLRLLFKVLISL